MRAGEAVVSAAPRLRFTRIPPTPMLRPTVLLALLCTLSAATAHGQTPPPAPPSAPEATPDTAPSPAPSREEQLAAARRAWRANGPSSYAYTLRVICFCNYRGDYEVEVRGGRIVSVGFPSIRPMTTEPGRQARLAWMLTVPQLFERLERQVRAGERNPVAYHPEIGYPTQATFGDPMDLGPPENPRFFGYAILDLRRL